MKSIRVLDTYEVRRMDALNWRVWQHKELTSGKRKGERDWVGLDSYHTSLASAVGWIAENAARETYAKVDADLEGALCIMREIEQDIAKHARKFEKAVGR